MDIYEFERQLVELGYTRGPREILALIRQHQPITLEFLNGYETCSSFNKEELLGKGKSGSVFKIDDDKHKGLPVVLKEFAAKEAPVIKNLANGDEIYVLSSSLNDIVMSSIFHSFYDGGIDFCLSFPYFEGFFVCGKLGYSVIEQLDTTMAKYIGGKSFEAETFKGLLFQVLYATRFMALKEIVHNDLHGKNVMIRGTEGISYRGVGLDGVNTFAMIDGASTYYLPNKHILAKIMDFDFAAKYSRPAITPQKVYNKRSDSWNLQFRFSTTYDLLTFSAYMVFYVIIRKPGSGAIRDSEIRKAREMVQGLAAYIVKEAELQVGPIENLGHFSAENNGFSDKRTGKRRTAVEKLMDMVSVPEYRPYEKYCHLRLDDLLKLDIFREYTVRTPDSLIIASM